MAAANGNGAEVFDDRPCELGEGPLWHPGRGQLFWFDIVNGLLRSRRDGEALEWPLGSMASAAGWIDDSRLLVATERSLSLFDIESGALEKLADLEADNALTRSNDGRADPHGGFWIGTMGKGGEKGAGAIYRYFKGEIRLLFPDITTPNAMCFSPDGAFAHFADTGTHKVMKQALDGQGWPSGDPEVFLDLGSERRRPDGAVLDVEGNLWIAEWGSSRVACYGTDGKLSRSVAVGGKHSSCPAFGGENLESLFVTTARQKLPPEEIAERPENGMVYVAHGVAKGLPENKVVLG